LRVIKGSNLPAQQGAILKDFVEIVHLARGAEVLSSNLFDPLKTFLSQLFAVLAVDLESKGNNLCYNPVTIFTFSVNNVT
jgi:hypothetical protein